MKKSTHFAFAAGAFVISCTGFILGGYVALGGGLGGLATLYAALAFRAHGHERRDA